jgi:hypothetical protein
MRTTLKIDDDVLLAAKALAEQRRITTGQALSQLARMALTKSRSQLERRNGVPLLPHRPGKRKVVTMALVNRLRDESP